MTTALKINGPILCESISRFCDSSSVKMVLKIYIFVFFLFVIICLNIYLKINILNKKIKKGRRHNLQNSKRHCTVNFNCGKWPNCINHSESLCIYLKIIINNSIFFTKIRFVFWVGVIEFITSIYIIKTIN